LPPRERPKTLGQASPIARERVGLSPMTAVAYSVTAQLTGTEMREQYIAWLIDGHVQAVLVAGASSAQVVVADGSDCRVETRYTFPDAAALSRYLDLHAPPLRAKGMRLFGTSTGVTFSRQTGTIVCNLSAAGS